MLSGCGSVDGADDRLRFPASAEAGAAPPGRPRAAAQGDHPEAGRRPGGGPLQVRLRPGLVQVAPQSPVQMAPPRSLQMAPQAGTRTAGGWLMVVLLPVSRVLIDRIWSSDASVDI